ncbi:MAG: hypothetical protein WC496_09360, partial [Phycisphaerae bacterium]
ADAEFIASTTGANANITFDQAGGGDLTVTSATTVNGDIDISVDSGDLTATLITAGDDGNILLDTTTSGNIRLGAVNAAADDVTLDSVGSILDNNAGLNNITAAVLNITGATTIGAFDSVIDTDIDTLNLSGVTGAAYFLEAAGIDLLAVNTGGYLSVQTTAGNITATNVDTSDDDVLLTSAGNIIVVDIAVDGATVTLDADGSITAPGDVAGVTAGTLTITDATSVGTGTGADAGFDTNVDTLNMSNVDGASYIVEDDGITLGAVNVNGLVNVQALLGDIAATSVITSDDDVTLTSTVGAITVGVINAGGGTATLTAATTINDASADEETDITAASINLDAVDGIGATQKLELSGTTIDADTTGAGAASIILSNITTTAATLTGFTTVGDEAVITFSQTGGGDLTVTSATTADGDITVSVDDGDLTATVITAGDDGNVNLSTTTGGDIKLGVVTAAADDVTLTSAGAITDENVGTNNILADVLHILGATTVGTAGDYIDTTITTLEMSGVSGASFIQEVDTLVLNPVNVGGAVTIATTAGPITATSVITSDDDVTLTAATGIIVGSIDADGGTVGDGGTVTLTAQSGTIVDAEAGEDTNIDIQAGNIVLNATGTIGSVAAGALDTQVTSSLIEAYTTGDAAHIDLDNTSTADAEFIASTTGANANITFDQAGGGDLTVTSATTVNGDIDISVAVADMTVLTITAGDDGDVSLDTTTSGDILLGVVTAAGDLITINSAGAIDDDEVGSGSDSTIDLIASELNLDAATGIGTTEEIETAATTIDADTTGNAAHIDLDNYLATTTTLTGISTLGTNANITFDQFGVAGTTGTLVVTSATTVSGNIDISSEGGNITAATVTAGGAGNVSIDTTIAGDVTVGTTATAADGFITITSAGAVTNNGTIGTGAGYDNYIEITAADEVTNNDTIQTIGGDSYIKITATDGLFNTAGSTIYTSGNDSYIEITSADVVTNAGDIETAGNYSYIEITATDDVTNAASATIETSGHDSWITIATDGSVTNNSTITTTGAEDSDITITAGEGADDDVEIGVAANGTVQADYSDITITAGGDLLIGNAGNDIEGYITTAEVGGNGDIKITVEGNVVMADTDDDDSIVNAGGWIHIDPVDVTIDGDGLEAVEFIKIEATGTVTNNATVTTTGTDSYVTIDAGDIVQDGDITTPVGSLEYVTLKATAGAVATGTITDTTDENTDITTTTLNITGATAIGTDAGGDPTDYGNDWLDTDVTTLNISGVDGSTFVLENDAQGDDIRLGTVDIDLADDEDFAVYALSPAMITVHSVDAAAGTTTLYAAGGFIRDADSDTLTDIASASIYLYGYRGIGLVTNALETSATTIEAYTVEPDPDADIYIDNVLSTPASTTTLTASTVGVGADIVFNQTGGSDLIAQSVTTTGGHITITVDDADLTATVVTAGGAGYDVALTTTDSGDIKLGVVTAADDEVTLTAAGAITDENGGTNNILADVLHIMEATTVGTVTDYIDTTITTLTMATGVSGASYILESATLIMNPVNVNGAVTVQTTAGSITATNIDTSDDDVTLTAATSIVVGNIDVDAGTVGSGGKVTLIAQNGSITDAEAGDDGNVDIEAGDIVLRATGTIGDPDSWLDTQITRGDSSSTIEAYTTGDDATIDIYNTSVANDEVALITSTAGTDAHITFYQDGGGDLTVTSATTVSGDIDVTVDEGDLTAVAVTASTSAANDGDVYLYTTDDSVSGILGDILLGVVKAEGDYIEIDSVGAIDDDETGSGADDVIDLIASELNLDAARGIGTTEAIETAATTIDADTTGNAAHIDLDNYLATATELTNFTTLGTNANITFDQFGVAGTTGTLTVTSATTVSGNIDISSEGGNITTVTITAGGAGNILVDTTIAGNITVGTLTATDAGTTTITDDTVYINSAGTILDDGVNTTKIVADATDLTADAGIGVASATGQIDTDVDYLAAQTENGDIIITESGANGSADEDLILRDVEATNGSIVLECTYGGMTHEAGSTITAGASTLTMIQAETIDLSIFTFTNQKNTHLMLSSTEGWVSVIDLAYGVTYTDAYGITLGGKNENAADQWKSIQAKAYGNILLEGSDLVRDIVLGVHAGGNPFDAAHTFGSGTVGVLTATNGGVSVVKSTAGTIYTYGHTTLDYVTISGYSDTTGSNEYGVLLPYIEAGEVANQRAAIVLVSETETLELSSHATLNADGTYAAYGSGTVDDRDGINFLDNLLSESSGMFPGEPFDLAIYLSSYQPGHDTGLYNPVSQTGENVVMNASVYTLAENAAVVIDAYDTITYGSTFKASPGFVAGDGQVLEVSSRITETIQDAWNLGTIPEPDVDSFADGLLPSWFGGDHYVLRGGEKDAWVLQFIDPVPIPPPVFYLPKDHNEVMVDCNELKIWTANELGLKETQVYLIEDTIAQSTDATHEQLCEMCEALNELAKTLSDADGTRLAALSDVVNELAPGSSSKELTYEQMVLIVSVLSEHADDGTRYAVAREWFGAMSAYVNILNKEFGWSRDKAIEFAMRKYASKLMVNNPRAATVVWMYLEQ